MLASGDENRDGRVELITFLKDPASKFGGGMDEEKLGTSRLDALRGSKGKMYGENLSETVSSF